MTQTEIYTQGQVWPYVFSNEGSFNNGTDHGNIYDPTRFISKIAMDALGFNVFLNALNEQGDTKSSPIRKSAS